MVEARASPGPARNKIYAMRYKCNLPPMFAASAMVEILEEKGGDILHGN